MGKWQPDPMPQAAAISWECFCGSVILEKWGNIQCPTCSLETLSGSQCDRLLTCRRRVLGEFGLRRQSGAATPLSHSPVHKLPVRQAASARRFWPEPPLGSRVKKRRRAALAAAVQIRRPPSYAQSFYKAYPISNAQHPKIGRVQGQGLRFQEKPSAFSI